MAELKGISSKSKSTSSTDSKSQIPNLPGIGPTTDATHVSLSSLQSNNLFLREFKSFLEVLEWKSSLVSNDFEKLKKKTIDLEQKEAETDKKYIEILELEKRLDKINKDAISEREFAQKILVEANELKRENVEKDEYLRKLEERLKPLLEKEQEIQATLEETKRLTKELHHIEVKNADLKNAALDEKYLAEKYLQQVQETLNQINNLKPCFWPPFLSGGDWDNLRKKLQGKCLQNDVNSSLVLAALHRYCASDMSNDTTELLESLKNLGRFLYASESPELVMKIGEAFNVYAQTLAPSLKFKLSFACPGQPPDPAWMSFPVGLTIISNVINWAVFKNSALGGVQIYSKAQVQ